MSGDIEGLKVVMLASVCGQHHSDDCQSCRSSHESNSDRITSLQSDLDAAREALRPFAELADEAEESASPLQNDRSDFFVTQVGGYSIGELHLEDFRAARTTLATIREDDQ